MTDSATQLIEDLSAQVFATGAREPGDPSRVDEALWATFLATGLQQALGRGEPQDIRNGCIVLRAAGHAAASVPACEVMLAHWLAARAGWEEPGAMPILVAGADDWQRVPWGRYATALYWVRDGFICRCGTPGAPMRLGTNVAGEPRDEIDPRTLAVQQSAVRIDADEVLCLAALCRAAMMAGAMDSALEMAVEHAAQRVQFGRPIAQFQAVAQMLAQLAAQNAAASAAVDGAAADFSSFTAAVAKARTSEAAGLATEIAHEVCGAMGFTVAYPLQRRTRRLWAWRDEDGSEYHWNRRIGTMVLQRCAGGLWPLLCSTGAAGAVWLP